MEGKHKRNHLGKDPVRKQAHRRNNLRGIAVNVEIVPVELRGLGPRAGGQSGDIQGLPAYEISGPESVEELAEEGQDFEAELICGVENVPDPDQGGLRPHTIREDNIAPQSPEYE
jgi:hypothetical protein